MLFSWLKRKKPQAPDIPPAQEPAEASELLGLGICAAAFQDQGKREEQQDAFALVNHEDVIKLRKMGLLAVVADGMGGMEGGKLASDTVVNGLSDSFAEHAPLDDPGRWMRQEIFRINDRILESLGNKGGSTLVACVVQEEKLWFASIGDSFLFLLRDGELNRLNRLQTVKQREFLETMEEGSADPSQGRSHVEANAITGFMGYRDLEDIDMLLTPMPLKAGDTLLLCSDGVGGVLDEEDLLYCFRQGKAEDVCNAIRQRVLSKNKRYQDNFTALVIQCVQ